MPEGASRADGHGRLRFVPCVGCKPDDYGSVNKLSFLTPIGILFDPSHGGGFQKGCLLDFFDLRGGAAFGPLRSVFYDAGRQDRAEGSAGSERIVQHGTVRVRRAFGEGVGFGVDADVCERGFGAEGREGDGGAVRSRRRWPGLPDPSYTSRMAGPLPRHFALRGFGRGLQAAKPTGHARRNLQSYRYTTRPNAGFRNERYLVCLALNPRRMKTLMAA